MHFFDGFLKDSKDNAKLKTGPDFWGFNFTFRSGFGRITIFDIQRVQLIA
jgi:hypothetical protein